MRACETSGWRVRANGGDCWDGTDPRVTGQTGRAGLALESNSFCFVSSGGGGRVSRRHETTRNKRNEPKKRNETKRRRGPRKPLYRRRKRPWVHYRTVGYRRFCPISNRCVAPAPPTARSLPSGLKAKPPR